GVAADQDVVTPLAEQLVGGRRGARVGGEGRDVGVAVAAMALIRPRVAPDAGVIAAVPEDDIPGGVIPLDEVVAGAAVNRVGSSELADGVVPISARHHVVACARRDVVITAAACDLVVAIPGVDR